MPTTDRRFIDSLRRRWGTSANAMRALGLDEKLIQDIQKEYTTMPRYTRDQENSAASCLRYVAEMIEKLPPSDGAQFVEGLGKIVAAGATTATGDGRRALRAADRRRHLGRDETEEERLARERREDAEDRGRLAADSAPARASFNRRFPDTARIRLARYRRHRDRGASENLNRRGADSGDHSQPRRRLRRRPVGANRPDVAG